METRQPCPSCEHLNPPEAERCERCGEPLGVVSRVFSRHELKGPPLWLKQTRQRAAEIKDYEETVSSLRFEALADIDRRREAAEAREQALRRQRDRKVIWTSILASLIFILVLLILALLALRG